MLVTVNDAMPNAMNYCISSWHRERLMIYIDYYMATFISHTIFFFSSKSLIYSDRGLIYDAISKKWAMLWFLYHILVENIKEIIKNIMRWMTIVYKSFRVYIFNLWFLRQLFVYQCNVDVLLDIMLGDRSWSTHT